MRRSALDLAGAFDERFSPGYGEEVDFSQRCVQRGLVHVVADDLFVYHRGGASFGVNARQEQHERILMDRYPYYHAAVREAADSERTPLARSLAAARAALGRMSVTIDGSALGPVVTGTQLHVLELAGSLARRGDVTVRIWVPRSIGETARAALDRLGVERFFNDLDPEDVPFSDVAHRPFQVVNPRDIALLRRLGRAVVVTQQDLIAFHNPAYFEDYAAWNGYRELAREALAAADRVAFFSRHAAEEAVIEDLVERDRARVVYIGVDHQVLAPSKALARPPALDERPFLLCLGTDFLHKNRVFAMEVFAALRERHAFQGRLVLAGRTPPRARPPRRRRCGAPRTPGCRPTWSTSSPSRRPRRPGCTPTPRSSCTRPCARASGWCRSRRPRPARRRCGPPTPPWPNCCRATRPRSSPGTPGPRPKPRPRCWPTTRRGHGSSAPCARPASATTGTARGRRCSPSTARPRPRPCGPAPAPARSRCQTSRSRWSARAATCPRTSSRRCSAVSTRPQLRRPVFGALVRAYRLMYKLRRS